MSAEIAQNRENFEFGGGDLPLSDFYKILHGEGVIGQHIILRFNPFGFKNVGLQPQNRYFGNNLPQSGMSPKQILPNLAWGGSPRIASSCQIFPLWL